MFGRQDAKKNEDFISKAQAARQQRAEGRQREKASIVIQVRLMILIIFRVILYCH